MSVVRPWITVIESLPSVLTHQGPTIVPVTIKTMFGMEAFALVKYTQHLKEVLSAFFLKKFIRLSRFRPKHPI